MTENFVSSILREEIQIEWEIKHFLDLPLTEGKEYYSQSFSFSNEKWNLSVIPYSKSHPKVIELYLFLNFCSKKYHIAATLGIKKANGSVLKSFDIDHVFDTAVFTGWGRKNFIDRTEIHQSKDILAPGGVLTSFCTARLQDKNVRNMAPVSPSSSVVGSCRRENYSENLLLESLETLSDNLWDLYLDGSSSDIKIRVQDREFRVHKSILSARSKVFFSMFNYEMAEKNQGVVEISDCDVDSFEDFLFFIYTGKLNRVSPSNAIGLYETVDMYDIEELQEECTEGLITAMSVDMVCDVILFAEARNEGELLETATQFFIDNVESIVTTKKWKSFAKENFELGNELFIKFIKDTKHIK